MKIETQISLDKFRVREYQWKFANSFEKEEFTKYLIVYPRRSGKDYIAFNLILRRALKTIGSYFYCLPTFKQARLVIWDSITMDGKRFLDCIPKDLVKRMNSQEMIIELINGSIIRMIGSDTYDTSLVGTNPVCVIFSEFALADDRAYKYVRPILNANGGSVVLLSTPRGHNSFYDLYQIAKNAPQEWYCEKLTVDDTQHIPIESIKKDIYNGEMSEELAKQEYWTDFDMGIEGSYYGRYVDKMRLEGRIGDVPWEPTYPVHISFDLGVNDSMVLIFFQVIGTVVHIIDYFEHDSEGLEYYVNYMHHKPYLYGKVIVPHDINVLEQGTGYSRYEKLSNLGVKATESPRLSLNDGIEAVRTVLPRVWIDQKNCSFLIKCLENYRREFDSLRKIYFDKPAKTQFNHGADAFRYMSISMGLLGKDSTPEEIDKRYKEVLYGPDDNLPPIFND